MDFLASQVSSKALYAGRFAQVHKCLGPTGRPMAVERIPPDLDPATLAKVEATARAVGGFSHVNVLRVLHCARGAEGGGLNVYTELVGGGSLKDVLGHFGALGERVAGWHLRHRSCSLRHHRPHMSMLMSAHRKRHKNSPRARQTKSKRESCG